jgi:hypothetical protein
MIRGALLCNPPLFATLFANRPVDEPPQAVFNPMSHE